MTTTTLSSRRRFFNLLGGMLKKNIPTAIYLFVILFLFFPLQMVLETKREIGLISIDVWEDIVGQCGMYTSASSIAVIAIMLSAAVIIGLVQCSYLHSKRAVDLYHSLPVTRTQLMCASMIAAFITLMVPFGLNYLINIGVSLYRISAMSGFIAMETLPIWEIFWDIFSWKITIFAILAVVMFVATQVGSVFEHFVFTCEILFAPILIILINEMMFESFLPGYQYGFDNAFVKLLSSVSPVGIMVGRFEGANAYYNWLALAWLLLGTAIFAASLVLYRRRKSEIAETAGCHGILGIILTTAAVYITSPAFGAMIFSQWGSDNHTIYVIGVVIGSVLTFLLFEAIFNRGFAGIKKHFPQGVGVCAFVTAVAMIIVGGGFGYVNRIPEVSAVKSVEVNYRGWYEYVEEVDPPKIVVENRNGETFTSIATIDTVSLTTPEAVEAVRKLHAVLIDTSKNPQENNYYYRSYLLNYDTNYSKLSRRYEKASDNITASLAELEATAEFQQQANPLLRLRPETVTEISLHNNLGFYVSSLTAEGEKNALLEALRKDAEIHGSTPYVGGEKIKCYLYINTQDVYDLALEKEKNGESPLEAPYINSFSVPVFAGYSNTLALLPQDVLVPATAEEVTEMCTAEYDTYKRGHGDKFVSCVPSVQYRGSKYGDSVTSDKKEIANVIENGITVQDDIRTNEYDGGWNYYTFYKGQEAGITVMLSMRDILNEPQSNVTMKMTAATMGDTTIKFRF